MLKTISKTGVDVIICLTMVVTVFYLAVITHIMPLPENVLSRISEVSCYGCSARLRHKADFIVLGLVLFLLMPLKS
jgi:hypothetical protein